MTVKNVWLLNHYANEPGKAGGTRHYGLARRLSESGWAMQIFASSVRHSTGQQRLASNEPFRREVVDGVQFVWLRCPPYAGSGRARIANMLAYSIRTLDPRVHAELPRPDAIIGSSVHPLAGLAGAALATRFRVPFLFEIRDLWPLTLIARGQLEEHGLTARTMRALEGILFRRATHVISLLPHAHEYVAEMGVDPDKVVWVPNGIDLADFPEETRTRDDGMFELLYLGSHTKSYDLDVLLHAMAHFQERCGPDRVRLRLVGDGPLKPELKKLANDLDLANVVFDAPVPKREIPSVCANADAFVVLVSDLPELYRYGLSFNKIFDYLAGARPTIIAISTGNNPIEDAHAGFTVPANDPRALAATLERVVGMPLEQRVEMGRAGRQYVRENHDFSILAARLGTILDDAVRAYDAGQGDSLKTGALLDILRHAW